MEKHYDIIYLRKQMAVVEGDGQAGATKLEEFLEAWENLVCNKDANPCQSRLDMLAGNLLRASNIKDWEQGKFGIGCELVAHVDISDGLKAGHYLARLDSALKFFLLANIDAARHLKSDVRVSNRGRRDSKRAVLVPVADRLQLPQQLGVRPLPAVIGLYALNDFESAVVGSDQCARPRVAKPLSRAGYRELYMLLFPGSLRARQSKGQVVQSGPELVGDFADHKRIDHWEGFNFADPENEPLLSIYLTPKAIEWRCKEPVGKVIQCVNVFACAPQFDPDRIQSVCHA